MKPTLREEPVIPLSEHRRRSRRSFLTGLVGVAAAGAGWQWVQTRPEDDNIPGVLRGALERNQDLWGSLPQRNAPEYPVSEAVPIQINGRIGLRNEIDLADWTVRVEGPDGELYDELTIDAFEALPQRDLVIEHKCIEGWSSIVHWGGARYSDFHATHVADRIPGDARYVYFETPDGEYYVGWELDHLLHPQTLLALREGDQPLTQAHGAPLRLATPNRYGIKTIKRIGTIRYTRERPADYWAERGYDWHARL